MDLLLLNPPQSFRAGNIWRGVMGTTPPLGVALLAAVAARSGHEVAVLDANAQRLDAAGLVRRLEGLRGEGSEPAWIGVTATTNIFPVALEAAGLARSVFPGARVVMGGVHPTVLPDEALASPAVDVVARGEGEESLVQLLAAGGPAGIRGLSWKDGERLVHEADRAAPVNMDDLPLPAYHLLPMSLYRPSLGSYRRLPAVGTVISRGCPGKCTFCYGHHLGRVTRHRPVASVLEEIRLLQADFGIREIAFYDDTFTARKGYVADLCQAILSAGLDLSWSCFSRVDCVSEELLGLMRRAGCHQICYGIESGSEEILRAIGKSLSLERAREAIRWTRRAGMETRATFMLGNPGETRATMEKTLRTAMDLDPDIALFNITTPFPGTEMFAWAQREGLLLTTDWARYDLSQPVMRLPTVSDGELQEFYRLCHRRFYGRPGYLVGRLLRMRTPEDVKVNWRAFRSVFLGR